MNGSCRLAISKTDASASAKGDTAWGTYPTRQFSGTPSNTTYVATTEAKPQQQQGPDHNGTCRGSSGPGHLYQGTYSAYLTHSTVSSCIRLEARLQLPWFRLVPSQTQTHRHTGKLRAQWVFLLASFGSACGWLRPAPACALLRSCSYGCARSWFWFAVGL